MRDAHAIPKEYLKFLKTDEIYSSKTPFEYVLDSIEIYFGGKRNLGTSEEIGRVKHLMGFIVPAMIFAEKGYGLDNDMELRTTHYVIDLYSDAYPAVESHPYFRLWKEKVGIFNTIAKHVPFRDYNLWQHNSLFEEYLNLYLKIQKDINK